MSFEINRFLETAQRIFEQALADGRLIANPDKDHLKAMVEKEEGVSVSSYGSFSVDSEPNSRAAQFTRNNVDDRFGDEEEKLLLQCEQHLAREQLVSLDLLVGNGALGTTARAIVPKRFAHLIYAGENQFGRANGKVADPTYIIIFFFDDNFSSNKSKPLPKKDITIRVAYLPNGRMVKIIRNSNYFGELKKGIFAAEDWVAKANRGGIFLHAGCRADYLQQAHGGYEWVRSLLIALSANGKTTTTSRVLAWKDHEESWLIQDDGGTLMPDGSFYGFEAGGIFVKTDGLNPRDQRETYYGALKPATFFENVWLDDSGNFDFYNSEKTSNGRAIIVRRDFMHAGNKIDVDGIENLVLITRGPTIPAICRLNAEQAAAFMVLGQAMQSSAGDPTQAGKIISEFFYDPFIAGDKAEHANIFYEIIKNLKNLRCFLINTGGVGEGFRYHDITLNDTMGILDSLCRGGLEDWEMNPNIGFEIPKAIRLVDPIFVHPERLFNAADFTKRQAELKKARIQAIEEVGSGLHPAIRKVFLP
ncbi:MAG: phosphoenolpyruvate carboxykinase (ATP) [Candidatus Abyssobacteria bacterium SURF_5]|uniref:Phosphoenolpyruvate carboxykinase (ATP) n=1 Tax=Abyssobacteria bacterium (strain SURF_5) TaxID=2093360 RepID=A0A3A4NZR0_ABYX5|nr:MAG: phosphoenolpyruvate carboxykinase (ATP) [Candidatus Abyssubacteria bacterium SURF_5]